MKTSLRTKMIISISFGLIITNGLGAFFSIKKTKDILYDNLKRKGIALSNNLAFVSKVGIMRENIFRSLDPLVDALNNESDVSYVCILNKNGEILSHSGMDKIKEHQNKVEKTTVSFYKNENESFYNIVVPVYGQIETWDMKQEEADNLKNVKLGMIRIGFSLNNVHLEIKNAIFLELIKAFLIMIIGVFIAIFISGRITRPIKTLVEATDKMSGGDLGVKINIESKDEIGGLADSFNEMTEKLSHTLVSRDKLEEALDTTNILLEQVPTGILVIGMDKRIIRANTAAMRLLGIKSADEIIGKTCHDIVHHRQKNTCPILDQANDIDQRETSITNKDGTEIPIYKTATKIVLEGNEVLLEAFTDISRLKEAEEKIVKNLQEKEVMLREIHHRVKNNLQIISSLLNMKKRNCINNEQAFNALMECQTKIAAMSIMHNLLKADQDFLEIDMKEFTSQLIDNLLLSTETTLNIIPEIEINDIFLPLDLTTPCGLIINELALNCIKHAFVEGKENILKISMTVSKKNIISLIVEDNGLGMPESYDSSKRSGVGLKLVKLLAEGQMDGNFKINNSGQGTIVSITFRDNS
jgi:PAS domain S-box-containing protein